MTTAKDEILEVMLIAGREKGKTLAQKRTMIFYKDFLIMAKGGSMAAGLVEGLGWALGGAAGGSIGKSMEESMVNKAKNQQGSTPQEILEADPDNILIKYPEIKSIKMSYSRFTGAKIQISTNDDNYKYNIPDHKNYKEYVKSLEPIFGNKLKT